jgi:hypothetical protein
LDASNADLLQAITGCVHRQETDLLNRLNKSSRPGKSLRFFRNRVKPLLQKYFCFSQTQISSLIRTVPFHKRGRLAIVTNAGRDAMDVGSARDERGLPAYGQVVWF